MTAYHQPHHEAEKSWASDQENTHYPQQQDMNFSWSISTRFSLTSHAENGYSQFDESVAAAKSSSNLNDHHFSHNRHTELYRCQCAVPPCKFDGLACLNIENLEEKSARFQWEDKTTNSEPWNPMSSLRGENKKREPVSTATSVSLLLNNNTSSRSNIATTEAQSQVPNVETKNLQEDLAGFGAWYADQLDGGIRYRIDPS